MPARVPGSLLPRGGYRPAKLLTQAAGKQLAGQSHRGPPPVHGEFEEMSRRLSP